jgi:chaperonin cofactor prefoldin
MTPTPSPETHSIKQEQNNEKWKDNFLKKLSNIEGVASGANDRVNDTLSWITEIRVNVDTLMQDNETFKSRVQTLEARMGDKEEESNTLKEQLAAAKLEITFYKDVYADQRRHLENAEAEVKSLRDEAALPVKVANTLGTQVARDYKHMTVYDLADQRNSTIQMLAKRRRMLKDYHAEEFQGPADDSVYQKIRAFTISSYTEAVEKLEDEANDLAKEIDIRTAKYMRGATDKNMEGGTDEQMTGDYSVNSGLDHNDKDASISSAGSSPPPRKSMTRRERERWRNDMAPVRSKS